MLFHTSCLPSHKQKLTDTFRQKWIKRKLHIRAGSVSWLRAGRTVKEIMSYGDFSKNTVMGEGDLASQLTWLQPFGLFCVGRFWIKGQSEASQQNQEPDPENQGGNGVPRQEHRGENLQDFQVPDRVCRRCWWHFYWLNWFSERSCANLFLLQWNRIVFSSAVSF